MFAFVVIVVVVVSTLCIFDDCKCARERARIYICICNLLPQRTCSQYILVRLVCSLVGLVLELFIFYFFFTNSIQLNYVCLLSSRLSISLLFLT